MNDGAIGHGNWEAGARWSEIDEWCVDGEEVSGASCVGNGGGKGRGGTCLDSKGKVVGGAN